MILWEFLRKPTYEEKMRIVQLYLNEELGIKRLTNEENMDYSLLNHWIHKYLDNDESDLKSKRHQGNTFAAKHTRTNLTELEKLRFTVDKKEIERLKKGYQVKEASKQGIRYFIRRDIK